jgi:hypothetical protein
MTGLSSGPPPEGRMNIELLTLFQVVIGPLLLAVTIAYGVIKYRQRGQATKHLTEETTRDLYREAAEQERREETPPLSPADADRSSWSLGPRKEPLKPDFSREHKSWQKDEPKENLRR